MAIIETERELEDFLYETAKNGFEDSLLGEFVGDGNIFRQVDITGYGIIDLLHISFDYSNKENSYPDTTITIIELKKDNIDYNSLGQISKYRTAIKRYTDSIKFKSNKRISYKIEGILIGNKINENSDFVYLVDNIEWLTLLTYSITLNNGLILHDGNSGWYSKIENFDALKKYLPAIMPKFLDTYKEYHSYNMSCRRHSAKQKAT